MVNKAEEKEIWKTYPKYPFIQASNLGRVRIKDRVVTGKDGRKYHYKGHILKQRPLKDGYMYVHFGTNGKTVGLRVNRVIAICFVPNPNNYPEVNHIDNDRTNNVVSNLEWCTSEYNVAYREKYGIALNCPVFAVDLKTGKVLRFKSQKETSRQLNISQGDISAVIRGKRKAAGGYWFTKNESEITEEKIQEVKANIHFFGGVIAVNLETKEALRFNSQHEAERQLSVGNSHICNVLKGRQKTAGGYYFCYVEKNAVEKVRAKFGDELAEKVKKLMNNKN